MGSGRCPSHRKSIRRDDIEGDFAALLQTLTSSKQLLTVARHMFEDAWNRRHEKVKAAFG